MALQGHSTEQFRATRTWNTIVLAVQSELPVRQYRKGFRMFTNCFAGKDAVTWTLDYLERNQDTLFDPKSKEITREKVTLLLQKFVEQKIIEDIHGRGHAFKDSTQHFYTFTKDHTLMPVTCRYASIKDTNRTSTRTRSSSLGHITPPTLRCATSMVKLALVGLSAQRKRRSSHV
ncbi:DEP domain-containing protein 1A-like [Varroa jacobsoni]|uniref:DEP domain-containing protein 1A-like n=1 Tax=Varroa jacobsoni TaxID=62625 RepID=UPI000BF36EE3|nr:DEP domain-containing protein 1A-like [Varroa jacobsoni]